jgi:biofilm PGA synthesis N-glycosyltransferase PgaC
MKALILIPAHNEARNIATSVKGAQNQTFPADALVICDNCTDKTEGIARDMGARVFETVGNTHKKAGALNQALAKFMGAYDYILIQDADTTIAPDLLSIAIEQLSGNPDLGAVCSKAGIKDIIPASWSEEALWRFQRIEYAIFDSSRIETLGGIKVLHGMATVYRAKALQEVLQNHGRIYDETNITEDYELTICLKELGWKVTANLAMGAWTVVPLKFHELWVQRVRWFRGGVDVLRTHGLNRITAMEFMQHALFMILTALNLAIMIALASLIYTGGSMNIHPLFYGVLVVTTLDGMYRLRYVQNLHQKEILLRVAIVPFSLYMQLYQVQQLWAYYLSLRNTKQRW